MADKINNQDRKNMRVECTVEVKRLPRGEFTDDGAFYARVNGKNIGENGRAFWPNKKLAQSCGDRFVEQSRNIYSNQEEREK